MDPFSTAHNPTTTSLRSTLSTLRRCGLSSLELPLLLLRILLLWNLRILKILKFADIGCVNVIVALDCFRVLERRIGTSQVLDLASLVARYVRGDNKIIIGPRYSGIEGIDAARHRLCELYRRPRLC